jgi:hypothetical protein
MSRTAPVSANSKNGSTSSAAHWLQQSVHQFFSSVNWEGHSPDVQELKLTALHGSDAPLSLTLTVSQFFGAIAWDGNAIATTPIPPSSTTAASENFTLEDFSDLF